MSGYLNHFLEIDLGSEKWGIKQLDPQWFETYVGGSALAARLFLDYGGVDIDPLAPEAALFVMTGPMTGTTFPGTSRFVMCARSPMTGIWGESASGGVFGAELKKTGVDGLIITGRSKRPVSILIEDGDVRFEDAGDLWGQDTFTTVDRLKTDHKGKRKNRVLAIGPAGENRVAFASVCNDKAHYIGRTGFGAIMGSKNLKAIGVAGSGKVPISNEEGYGRVKGEALSAIKDSMVSASMRELGTAAAMDMGMMTGDVPIKNWTLGVDYDLADALGGPAIHDSILVKRRACFACPIGCKPVVTVDHPDHPLEDAPGPEYETCACFGTMIMNDDLKAVARVNDLCNRLGLDTISCGGTIAFVMEAFERNLLTIEDTDGLEMTWGNMEAVEKMVPKIAGRDGFGDRAAMGSRRLAESLGKEAEAFAVTVKGLELPMHDPRAFHGQGLSYMNSNRGACHLQHSVQAVEQGMVSWEETGLEDDYAATESAGKAKMVYLSENIGQMANALCICHFVQWSMRPQLLIDGFNSIAGLELDMQTFQTAGSRAWLLKRALNNLMGVTRADDRLPRRILTPLKEGGAEGSVPDEDLMRAEYYEIRGLDENGIPTEEVLEDAGLGYIMPLLKEKRG